MCVQVESAVAPATPQLELIDLRDISEHRQDAHLKCMVPQDAGHTLEDLQ